MLDQMPVPEISETYLDFGFDTTALSFLISNPHRQAVVYILKPSQKWISVTPAAGLLGSEPETITVELNRPAVSDLSYKEYITVSAVLSGRVYEITRLNIYVNPLKDVDGNYEVHRPCRYAVEHGFRVA